MRDVIYLSNPITNNCEMMKANALSLSLLALAYLFLLQILINSNKASASASWLSLPNSDKDEQRCGYESCYEKCPPGSCCSRLGYCGTTIKHCGGKYCKTQCPSPPPSPPTPPPAPGRCGEQADGRKCPTGLCCSSSGWCGTTKNYCDPKYCQRQCRLPPEAPPPPPDAQQCGVQGGGKKCPNGMCCAEQGWCGTTQYYCNPKWCQSQCQIPYLSSNNRTTDERQCGRQGCFKECPPGSCCSILGYCGTTRKHCSAYWCQSQCPSPSPPPPPPYAPGRCGMQAGGRKCPTGLCCSSSGWCGTTEYYCAKQWCQSQCNIIISSTKNSTETFLLDGVV